MITIIGTVVKSTITQEKKPHHPHKRRRTFISIFLDNGNVELPIQCSAIKGTKLYATCATLNTGDIVTIQAKAMSGYAFMQRNIHFDDIEEKPRVIVTVTPGWKIIDIKRRNKHER